MQFSRPVPPPPPPPRQPEQDGYLEQSPPKEKPKHSKLSAKTKFGLFIAGGVLSLAISAVCIVLIFIL